MASYSQFPRPGSIFDDGSPPSGDGPLYEELRRKFPWQDTEPDQQMIEQPRGGPGHVWDDVLPRPAGPPPDPAGPLGGGQPVGRPSALGSPQRGQWFLPTESGYAGNAWGVPVEVPPIAGAIQGPAAESHAQEDAIHQDPPVDPWHATLDDAEAHESVLQTEEPGTLLPPTHSRPSPTPQAEPPQDASTIWTSHLNSTTTNAMAKAQFATELSNALGPINSKKDIRWHWIRWLIKCIFAWAEIARSSQTKRIAKEIQEAFKSGKITVVPGYNAHGDVVTQTIELGQRMFTRSMGTTMHEFCHSPSKFADLFTTLVHEGRHLDQSVWAALTQLEGSVGKKRGPYEIAGDVSRIMANIWPQMYEKVCQRDIPSDVDRDATRRAFLDAAAREYIGALLHSPLVHAVGPRSGQIIPNSAIPGLQRKLLEAEKEIKELDRR